MAKRASGGNGGRLLVGLAVGALVGLLAYGLDLPGMVSLWGDLSLAVPIGAIAAAILWLTPVRAPIGALALLLGLLWLAVAFTPLVPWLARDLVRRDPPQAADAVFVFGSVLQDDGDPTGESMTRLLRGVQLVAAGRARRLVVSELRPPSKLYAPIAREWTEQLAPGVEVLAVGPVGNTRDEAVAVAEFLRRKGWRRVLAVTSPVHSRRAAASLEKLGLKVVSVPSIETRFDLETLDEGRDRLRAFAPVAHERLGLLVYRRKGWI